MHLLALHCYVNRFMITNFRSNVPCKLVSDFSSLCSAHEQSWEAIYFFLSVFLLDQFIYN